MDSKVSRVGHPGDLVVALGSQEGGSCLGELRLQEAVVYSENGPWYRLNLQHPVPLDTRKLYWFEVRSVSGQATQGSYAVCGLRPLGGTESSSQL